ncbi:MAG: PIG-L deacetylase family protein [Ktedonobacteraceae bacterium]
MTTQPSSVLLPPGGQRILVIQAHPDDAEFLCGGTVARLVAEERDVQYLFLTYGEQGSDDPEMTPDRLAAIREQEQRRAADFLGVKSVTFLAGYHDGEIEPTLALRRELAGMIRRLKPDIVLSFDPWAKNDVHAHPDHRATAVCALDAMAVARGRLSYPDQLVDGITPHSVQHIYFYGTDRPNHWVDISSTIDIQLAALHLHTSQMQGFEDEFIRRRAIQAGAELKYTYAEVFHRFSMA